MSVKFFSEIFNKAFISVGWWGEREFYLTDSRLDELTPILSFSFFFHKGICELDIKIGRYEIGK